MLLGIGVFFISKNILYLLMIFFIPFSATVVINFPSGFGLQATQFLGILLFIKMFIEILKSKEDILSFAKKERIPIMISLFFFLSVIISILMPLFINGNIQIKSFYLGEENQSSPLQFNSRHITTPMYVLYGILILFVIMYNSGKEKYLEKTIKVYIFSIFILSTWGLFQFFCGILNIKYPYYIFNTSLLESTQGYKQVIWGTNLVRISSAAIEPSMFAQSILTIYPLICYLIVTNTKIFNKWLDYSIFIIVSIALILSTSSTAYLGIVLTFLFVIVTLLLLKRIRRRHIYFFGIFLGCLFIFYLLSDQAQFIVHKFIFEKLGSGSGIERSRSIEYALSYFKEYPIFGIGWGSITSFDMIAYLLASIGIIGTTLFFVFMFLGFKRIFRLVHNYNNKNQFPSIVEYSRGICISFLTLLIIQITGGFWWSYGHFWYILGALYAIHGSLSLEVNSKKP
jgi:hypothetical protein